MSGQYSCPKCGAIYSQEEYIQSMFCRKCGTYLRRTAAQKQPQHTDVSDLWNYIWESARSKTSLKTLHEGKKFRLDTLRDWEIVIIPESTKIERPLSRADISNVWNKFAEIKSFNPGDYQLTSRNASYILTLIAEYKRNTP
jgi:uncharacterized Zn finger protein